MPKSPPRHYETSSIRWPRQGAVVTADIVESDDFGVVKRYDELMAREGVAFHSPLP